MPKIQNKEKNLDVFVIQNGRNTHKNKNDEKKYENGTNKNHLNINPKQNYMNNEMENEKNHILSG